MEQIGEMLRGPGVFPRSFTATEEFVLERVAFVWRARFPMVGPLFDAGDRQL